jgi:double zinc ribbon protein/FHA domain-containing protein
MPRCIKCDKQNREGARFCEECGARLSNPTTVVAVSPGPDGPALVCPVCGLQNAPQMNFCRRCGGKLPKSDLRSTMQFAAVAGPLAAASASVDHGPPQVAVLMPPPREAPPPTPVMAAPAPVREAAVAAPKQPCPSCGGLTPLGFAFCQLCGVRMETPPATPTPPKPVPVPRGPGVPGSASPAPSRRGSPAPAPRPTPIGVPSTAPTPGRDEVPVMLAEVRLVAIRRDGADGEAHPFRTDKVALGRREGDVTFASDPYLADRHARLELRGGRWFIVDLGSRNGTFVRTRGAVILGAHEVMLAGKQVMAIDLLPGDQQDTRPAEEHGVLLFGTPVKAAWARLRQLTLSGVARDVHYLCRPEIALGREDGDILFPEDEFMSRCHVVLGFQDGAATLIDQGSSNGTYLRVRGEREIVGGDHIRLGDQLLRFEIP